MLITLFCLLVFAKSCISTEADLNSFLTNYWPIENGQMLDIVGNAHMYPVNGSSIFEKDRNGISNSALHLKDYAAQVPTPGIVFKTQQFTATLWFYSMFLYLKIKPILFD